jgi:N6-adenosine-specific RNA methylase IME4
VLNSLNARFECGPFAGLPRAHYRVAHVDSPWTFHAWSHRGNGRGACQHYRCQSLEEIISLPVDQLMPKLWSEGLFPLRIRPRMGLGYHTRSGTEQCWLATRGKGYKRQSMAVEQVVFAPIREHLRKPDEVANRIDRLVGDAPRIELPRAQRPGWTAWGDQVGLFARSAS